MLDLEVTVAFYDKEEKKQRSVGDLFKADQERGNILLEKGYAKEKVVKSNIQKKKVEIKESK